MTRNILFSSSREVTEKTNYGPLVKKVKVEVVEVEGKSGMTIYYINTYWNSQLVNGWMTPSRKRAEEIIALNSPQQ